MQEFAIATSAGTFTAWFSSRGLARLKFPPRPSAPVARQPRPCLPDSQESTWAELAGEALRRVLVGQPPGRMPPLDLSAGTDFQRQVWAALRRIAAGQTRTYQEVAAAIGRPQAPRAVGLACGANPIPVLIPCHRVVPKTGGLGGFSGGTGWKRWLLTREGAKV